MRKRQRTPETVEWNKVHALKTSEGMTPEDKTVDREINELEKRAYKAEKEWLKTLTPEQLKEYKRISQGLL